ncbi:MAG: hypothetical protein F4X82_00285 [Candidatus Spechtbacteria bacterium SB0662_bin_43]|uniref:Uncharacterized protein n=1 Tax=Candidatus Spechtbacteria bacterium SB0662_bin_43 TaxID=2604897 RepID=A0A845D9A4_9BACT|nr:hypothetical protein [Candidatus Spechtbacteria bacterium SB0662_bin_43]
MSHTSPFYCFFCGEQLKWKEKIWLECLSVACGRRYTLDGVTRDDAQISRSRGLRINAHAPRSRR